MYTTRNGNVENVDFEQEVARLQRELDDPRERELVRELVLRVRRLRRSVGRVIEPYEDRLHSDVVRY
jgi:hypothetical protein